MRPLLERLRRVCRQYTVRERERPLEVEITNLAITISKVHYRSTSSLRVFWSELVISLFIHEEKPINNNLPPLFLKPIILAYPFLCWFLILSSFVFICWRQRHAPVIKLCVRAAVCVCLSGCVWVCLLGHHCLSSVTAEDLGLKSGLINIECFDGININAEGHQIFISQWMQSWKYPAGLTSLHCTDWTETNTQYLRVPPMLRGNQRCCFWQMTGSRKKHNLLC